MQKVDLPTSFTKLNENCGLPDIFTDYQIRHLGNPSGLPEILLKIDPWLSFQSFTHFVTRLLGDNMDSSIIETTAVVVRNVHMQHHEVMCILSPCLESETPLPVYSGLEKIMIFSGKNRINRIFSIKSDFFD